jgi:hypothetical protein
VCREAFFPPSWQDSVVFENSAACVYVETSAFASAWLCQLNGGQLNCVEEQDPSPTSVGDNFEHKLEVNKASPSVV